VTLTLESISYDAQGKALLDGVTLSLPDGTLTCLVGANGAGKTTLLRILAGELRATAGRLLIDQTDAASLTQARIARQCSIIPQDVPPPQHLTVFELVALGRFRPHGAIWWRLKEEDRGIVQACLDLCQIGQLAGRRVDQLSGGEQQRAWVAFGLSQQKRFLLLDETLGGMDVLAKGPFFRLLKQIAGEGKGVVLTTHDLDLVADFADRVVVLSRGRVAYDGSPRADLRHFLAQ